MDLKNYRISDVLCILKGLSGSDSSVYIGNGDSEKNFLKSKGVEQFKRRNAGVLQFFVKNEEVLFKIKPEIDRARGIFYLRYYIKHPEIPGDKDGWNSIENLAQGVTNELLLGNLEVSEEGELISLDGFRVCTMDQKQDYLDCLIINQNSVAGEMIENDTLVQGIFDSSKKTRKRVIGNLYMTETTEKLYYLGDYYRRNIDEIKTGKEELSEVFHVYLPETELCGETSVSEVLIKYTEMISPGNYGGKKLKIFSKNSSWVNLGPGLEYDPGFDIRDHWEEIADRYITEHKGPRNEHSTLSTIKRGREFFNMFRIVPEASTSTLHHDSVRITPKCRELVKEVLSSHIHEYLTEFYWKPGDEWVDGTCPYVYKDKKDLDEPTQKRKSFIQIYRDYFTDTYIYSDKEVMSVEKFKTVVKEFFNLDIEDIYDSVFQEFRIQISDIPRNIQDLVNWKSRIQRFIQPCKVITQTTEFQTSSWSRIEGRMDELDKWPAEDTPELRKLLLKMYQESFKSAGENVRSLSIQPYSYKKKTTNVVMCLISIEDIINHYKGIDKIPAAIQKELLRYNFTEFKIVTNNEKRLLK